MDIVSGTVNSILHSILGEQLQHEKKGQYTEAQKCRKEYEKQKEKLNQKHLNQMNNRHSKERDDLNNARKQQLQRFNQLFDQEMEKFTQSSDKMEKQMKNKHSQEIEKTKDDLDKHLSPKVKESSELLNLRKMEEQMAKQKNYPQAHKIQTKINKMLQEQTQNWNKNRGIKMETALNTLKAKQKTELTNFQKRVKTATTERTKQKQFEEAKINLKYDNLMKDLKVIQEREVLGFKGEFKSLGGTAQSSPVKTKRGFVKNV